MNGDCVEVIKQLIICDAGPIIHLDELECLTILNFPEIVIPKTVHEEINNTRLISFDKYPNLKIVPDPRVPNDILESSKIYELHQGEIMAISIALESKNAILLTDESIAAIKKV